jgi:hypothetical protein
MKYSENGIRAIFQMSIRYTMMKTDEPPNMGGLSRECARCISSNRAGTWLSPSVKKKKLHKLLNEGNTGVVGSVADLVL